MIHLVTHVESAFPQHLNPREGILQVVARGRGAQLNRLTAAANHEPERAFLETRNQESQQERLTLVSYENKR